MSDVAVSLSPHQAVAYVDGKPVPVIVSGGQGPQGPAGPGGSTSDTPYGPAWDGAQTVSPSQNAVYDKLVTVDSAIASKANTSALASYLPLTGGNITGNITAVNANFSGALGVTGAATFGSTLSSGSQTIVGNISLNGVFSMTGTTASIILGAGPIARITAAGATATLRANQWHWEKESDGATLMDLSVLGLLTAPGGMLANGQAGGIGYGTGAGGSVTQTGDKSQPVTLNRPCGRIVTMNTSIAANSSAFFTLNNSLIGANDCVLVSLASGNGSLIVHVDAIGAGSCRIQLWNRSGGADASAINLNFVVIKGVAA
jgi:hypothetical protein